MKFARWWRRKPWWFWDALVLIPVAIGLWAVLRVACALPPIPTSSQAPPQRISMADCVFRGQPGTMDLSVSCPDGGVFTYHQGAR